MIFKRSNKKGDVAVRRRQSIEDDSNLPSGSTTSQYRRNQTLSSYKHNTPDESSRQKAHQLAKQRRRLSGVFVVVIAAVIFLAILLWQLVAQVSITTSSRQLNQTFEAGQYEALINEYLAVNPSQRLRFALNEAALTGFVSGRLPEVEKLELSGIPGVAQGNFVITFRTPVAGWVINDKQYYVDADGVVFEKNYYESPSVQIVDESGINPDLGDRLLGFLGRVVAQAKSRGYTITRAVLPANTTRQVDVYVEGSSARIKLSIDRGAGEQVEDADRVLKYLSSQGFTPQYVDVRVPGRAAYR